MLALLLVGGIAVAGTGGAMPKPRKSAVIKIPLPAAGQASVHLITLKLRVTSGPRKLTVKNLNDARLPAEIRAVAGAVIQTRSRTRQATYKVFVFMNNLASPRRLAESIDNEMDFGAYLKGAVVIGIHDAVMDDNCSILNYAGGAADGGDLAGFGSFVKWGLAALRDKNEQPSDPEAVLDHVVYNLCSSQGAEVPEDGSG